MDLEASYSFGPEQGPLAGSSQSSVMPEGLSAGHTPATAHTTQTQLVPNAGDGQMPASTSDGPNLGSTGDGPKAGSTGDGPNAFPNAFPPATAHVGRPGSLGRDEALERAHLEGIAVGRAKTEEEFLDVVQNHNVVLDGHLLGRDPAGGLIPVADFRATARTFKGWTGLGADRFRPSHFGLLSDVALRALADLYREIWARGRWPSAMLHLTLVLIPRLREVLGTWR